MIRPHEAEGSEPVARTAGIPESIAISLRKEETSAMICAMRNSIAESATTAPMNPMTRGVIRAHLQPERVSTSGAKNFV
jgi:hypothetical protein